MVLRKYDYVSSPFVAPFVKKWFNTADYMLDPPRAVHPSDIVPGVPDRNVHHIKNNQLMMFLKYISI